MKKAIITTTIRVPRNLEAYAKDIGDAVIIIAGDRKTPHREVDDLARHLACEAEYMGPESQDQFLLSLGDGGKEYADFLPWDCVQRRNVAILAAYHNGAEIIATVDDDNHWEGEGYFQQHGPLGQEETIAPWTSRGGWLNVCKFLTENNHNKFYHRGFSFANRNSAKNEAIVPARRGRRVVNAGLWIGDPDIDAVTRMALSPVVNSYQFENLAHDFHINLDIGTKSPFNSQNTALHRDVIPAYCMITGVGRYDDIIPSYVVKRIADHLGDYISFGKPVVRQVRNQHDIFRDLDDELLGMRLIDRIVNWLYEIPLSGKDYKECIAELIMELEQKMNAWFIKEEVPQDQMLFLRSIIVNYRHWMAVT